MIKKIVMKNLICSGCAGRIEKALSRLGYIKSASFNFPNQTMLLDVTDAYDESRAIPEIREIVDSIEHGVETYPYERRNVIIQKGFFRQQWLVFVGIAVFLTGYILYHFTGLVRANPTYWIGYFIIAHKIALKTFNGIRRKDFFNENTLMFIATVAAMSIGKPFEAIFVILFYSIGEHLQHRAVNRSKREINTLMDLKIDYANVLDEEGSWVVKDPMAIKTGDMIRVKNGERIPVDGIIKKGATSLNTSAITGEAKLTPANEGDYVLSGHINVGGVIDIEAGKEYNDSTIAKIIDLIESATDKKSRTEAFITRFAKIYTPVVTVLAMFMFLIPTLFDPGNYQEYIFRAATFLVISCPCALVLSIPLSYFAGIGASARQGILFKGSNFLDMMREVDVIGLDKTGTLTHGNFAVEGYTNPETLKLAASLDAYSNHPIAHSIVQAYSGTHYPLENVVETPGFGIEGRLDGKEVLAGSRTMLIERGIEVSDPRDTAGTNVFVAKDGKYVGRVVVKDQIRATSKAVIKKMKRRFDIIMLTGDNKETASEVAFELGGIDFRHSLLPEDKIEAFDAILSKRRKMYVGDGINDAPLIKNADIGVAMGTGSELAIDVADIIVMDDDFRTLHKAFGIAHKTRGVVLQNIVLSLGVKFSFLILAAFGLVTMWMAIFADVGITLIAIMNALRLIYGRKSKTT